jgi:hypothetical protein
MVLKTTIEEQQQLSTSVSSLRSTRLSRASGLPDFLLPKQVEI